MTYSSKANFGRSIFTKENYEFYTAKRQARKQVNFC